MKISVVIPAYNAAASISATLESVFGQSCKPYEILVLDDGSTDETPALLKAFEPRIKVYTQTNSGVAHARNFLCRQTAGDTIAFLDADDVWHPAYLQTQAALLNRHPDAVASFSDHENVQGYSACQWAAQPDEALARSEVIGPVDFMGRYNRTPLCFQMSCSCVPVRVLHALGVEPFPVVVSGADDTYFHVKLPLLGNVIYTPTRLAGYRITSSSISADRLKMSLQVVKVFEMLAKEYNAAHAPLLGAFRSAHAARLRNCGKYLMGAGRITEARRQFFVSASASSRPRSVAKSLVLYGSSFLPSLLQPQWPTGRRAS